MAKVKYLGDPNGQEHRSAIEHAGVTLARGEWAEVPDHAAKKLAQNPHFEVKGVSGDAEVKSKARDAAYLADLEASNSALTAELNALHTQFEERGATLQAATARIAELEAALASAEKAVAEAPAKSAAKK